MKDKLKRKWKRFKHWVTDWFGVALAAGILFVVVVFYGLLRSIHWIILAVVIAFLIKWLVL